MWVVVVLVLVLLVDHCLRKKQNKFAIAIAMRTTPRRLEKCLTTCASSILFYLACNRERGRDSLRIKMESVLICALPPRSSKLVVPTPN